MRSCPDTDIDPTCLSCFSHLLACCNMVSFLVNNMDCLTDGCEGNSNDDDEALLGMSPPVLLSGYGGLSSCTSDTS